MIAADSFERNSEKTHWVNTEHFMDTVCGTNYELALKSIFRLNCIEQRATVCEGAVHKCEGGRRRFYSLTTILLLLLLVLLMLLLLLFPFSFSFFACVYCIILYVCIFSPRAFGAQAHTCVFVCPFSEQRATHTCGSGLWCRHNSKRWMPDQVQ